MLDGRDFSPAFSTDSTACIINESTVQKMGLKEPVVGQKIGGKNVIGVFQNFVYNNPSGIIAPMVISLQTSNLPHFFVRIKNDDHWQNTLAQIEKAVKKINHNHPFEYSFTKADYQRDLRNGVLLVWRLLFLVPWRSSLPALVYLACHLSLLKNAVKKLASAKCLEQMEKVSGCCFPKIF